MASRSFPAIPKSVHEARHFAQQQLPAGPDPDVALVVSELATNAVLHAGTSFTVTVEATPGVVHIEVADQSERLPNHRDRRDDTTTGRGLFLVSAVAARWGFHAQSAGKVIWADVAIDDGTARATAGPAASEAASG